MRWFIKNTKEGGTGGSGRMNGGDEGEGIWLMGFIYIYEIEKYFF
jgi:hypothetical protein